MLLFTSLSTFFSSMTSIFRSISAIAPFLIIFNVAISNNDTPDVTEIEIYNKLELHI